MLRQGDEKSLYLTFNFVVNLKVPGGKKKNQALKTKMLYNLCSCYMASMATAKLICAESNYKTYTGF